MTLHISSLSTVKGLWKQKPCPFVAGRYKYIKSSDLTSNSFKVCSVGYIDNSAPLLHGLGKLFPCQECRSRDVMLCQLRPVTSARCTYDMCLSKQSVGGGSFCGSIASGSYDSAQWCPIPAVFKKQHLRVLTISMKQDCLQTCLTTSSCTPVSHITIWFSRGTAHAKQLIHADCAGIQ